MLPSYLFFFELFLRVNIRFHSSGKETLIFLEIADIDLILQQLLPSLHFKIEPLQMPSGIAIHSHEAIILPLPHPHHAIQVSALEEGIKQQIVLGFPVLSAEGPIRELHIVGSLDVVIGEAKRFVVPGIVGILVSRTQVAELCPLSGLLEHSPDEVVESFALEDDGDWDWKVQLCLPTNHSIHAYPVSMSGLKE